LTPAEQQTREQIRMEAAARFEQGESISHVARAEVVKSSDCAARRRCFERR
jgi:hypothetical protein